MNGSAFERQPQSVASDPERGGKPEQVETVRSGLTPRAFWVGLGLCILLGVMIPYQRMIIQGSKFNSYYFDPGAIFLFFCLVVGINPLLRWLGQRFTLLQGELLSIYTMLLFLLPAARMAKYLLTFISGVSYYASPERRHLEAVLPHILPWMAPQQPSVVKGLYEGFPKGEALPWFAWLAPLWSWGALLVALYGVLICLSVLLRKQWEDHERFSFPLMQVPLEMSEVGKGKFGPLFKNWVMWSGFAVPFCVGSLRALHNYHHFFPEIRLQKLIWIFRRTTPLPFSIGFSLLGYSYFMNLDVSLSIWLLNVISRCIRGSLAVVGMDQFDVSGVVGRFSSRGSAFLAMMGMGYMLALAAYSLWTGREHFRDVWSRILGRASRVDDSDEIIPYRKAFLGLLGGLLYAGCWLYQAEISPFLILFLLFSCLVVFLVLARIVSETGFAVTYSPINPAEFVVCAVGSSAFQPAGLVTIGFSYFWTMTQYNTLMPRACAALRLAGKIARKKGLIWAMVAALVVGGLTTSYMTLDIGYSHGGLNLDRDFHDRARLPFDEFVGRRMLEPSPIFYMGFLYLAIGAGLTFLLIVLRARLSWWPLHPVALPLNTIWFTDHYFFSVFLAWGIKVLVLKFGGPRLYRSTRPFFVGVILGEAVCIGVWAGIDYLTGMTGNIVSS